jgi:DNA-binding transcriptional MerR regulator
LAGPPAPPRLPAGAPPAKAAGAFRTIGELAADLGVAPHVLRYWETRFPQLRPLQRAGNRRYYRPDDVALAQRIHQLLNVHGYTIKGVQTVLARADPPAEEAEATVAPPSPAVQEGPHRAAVVAIRDFLVRALEQDGNET